jgi:hypothetical protein
MSHGAFLLLSLLAGLVVYGGAPGFIALVRRHPERRLIYTLCPLTLLSFILWMVLLAWAFTGRRDDAIISRYVAKLRGDNRLPLAITLLVLAGFAGSLLTLLR